MCGIITYLLNCLCEQLTFIIYPAKLRARPQSAPQVVGQFLSMRRSRTSPQIVVALASSAAQRCLAVSSLLGARQAKSTSRIIWMNACTPLLVLQPKASQHRGRIRNGSRPTALSPTRRKESGGMRMLRCVYGGSEYAARTSQTHGLAGTLIEHIFDPMALPGAGDLAVGRLNKLE